MFRRIVQFFCIVILFFIILSCPYPRYKFYTYNLKSVDIGEKVYKCMNYEDYAIKTSIFVEKLVEFVKTDINMTTRNAEINLHLDQVGTCILDKSDIETLCGGKDIIGCYFFYPKVILVSRGYGDYPIVHELLHHIINILDSQTKEKIEGNRTHEHMIWLKYDVDLRRIYNWNY